ncbi:hypothetical protein, partial [Salinibacter ruber]|uniref:hypothetical protein n=1 Tax=Salinibacter ruber TaxID=146919 RepID=UPI002169E263
FSNPVAPSTLRSIQRPDSDPEPLDNHHSICLADYRKPVQTTEKTGSDNRENRFRQQKSVGQSLVKGMGQLTRLRQSDELSLSL